MRMLHYLHRSVNVSYTCMAECIEIRTRLGKRKRKNNNKTGVRTHEFRICIIINVRTYTRDTDRCTYGGLRQRTRGDRPDMRKYIVNTNKKKKN